MIGAPWASKKKRSTLRERIPLRRRKILKGSLWNTLLVALFGGVITLIGYALLETEVVVVPEGKERAANLIILGWFLTLIVLTFWRMIYQYLYYVCYFYDADDQNITIRKGIVTKREIIMPFKRITDVYIDQDFWDVALGLYDVHISTPTVESGTFAHIDGVDRDGADQLRKLILDKIHHEEK